MNTTYISDYILTTISRSKRPIESRTFARSISKRFRTSIYRVYGIISALTRSGKINFTVRKPGGLSYIR